MADELLADVLRVHAAVRLELGVRSVLVEGPAIIYATESILNGYFTKAAAEAGFTTPEGLKLHDRAMQSGQASLRALTACLAATKALAARDRGTDPGDHQRQLVEAFGADAEGT